MNIVPHNVTYPYIYWDNFFSEEELTKMQLYFESQELKEGKVVGFQGEEENNDDIRITSVSMIRNKKENDWIFDRLFQLTGFINNQFYNYDITGFNYLQYTVYDKIGSHYSYHMDMVMDDKHLLELPRKLSFSLIFSERHEFDGGDFDFMLSEKEKLRPEQKRGRVLAFPSFLLHRVTPVTFGVRKSLVFWATGPKFK